MSNVLAVDRLPTGGFIPQVKLPKAEVIPFPLPQPTQGMALHINLPELNCNFTAPVLDCTQAARSGEVTIRCYVDTNVVLAMLLIGKMVEDGNSFRVEEVLFNIEQTEDRARAEFVSSSLLAMLGLGTKIDLTFPAIGLNLDLRLNSPLSTISQLLQRRQTAYRLMIIERATNKTFLLPKNITGSEMEAISFTYHAIIDRSFIFPFKSVQIYVPATQDWLNAFKVDDQPRVHVLPENTVEMRIFDQSIQITYARVIVEEGIFLNADRIRKELSANDGHLVEVVLLSLSGSAKYEISAAPRLPADP